ncbi:DUF4139 domain-containing protein [Polyangium aurulentum]|uniref:DUF4139 domain-containing protein n=1 Tax=Polyangium aurulentum TaxID=2567896 RepID=UPI0010AEC7D8|nr:DUF4139 domain-containing protein [Polyangium aurulentum]UQA61158.1 DUF4139 domain-containing protein [Polyangium aurulentum]
MSPRPTIRRIVLFKQGLAHIERRGPAEGVFELPFGRTELGEVLRSLAAWVERGDARITSIAFDAPDDADATLAERKMRFEPGAALRGFVNTARGRRVRIDSGEGPIEGEVIGFEESPGGQGPPRRTLLLRADRGRVAVVDLATVRGLEIIDPALQDSLAVLVDRGRAAASAERRAVRISLSGQAEDVCVSYVVPCPAYAVSYRLVCDGPVARLFAFGLISNPLEEDLEGVDLVLTTSQPTAAEGMRRAHTAERNETEPRVDGAMALERTQRVVVHPATIRAAAAAPIGTLVAMHTAKSPEARITPEHLEETVTSSDEIDLPHDGAESSPFEWRAPGPVSIPRRGAAMVPLLSADVRVRKERVWRDGGSPNPDLLLSFVNDAGTLPEEGACAVYDAGSYAGESAMPAAHAGTRVHLSFTKDLAVRCRKTSTKSVRVLSLSFDAAGILEQQRCEERHVVTLESDHAAAVDVMVELARRDGRALAPGNPMPFEETSQALRYRIEVPPRGATTLEMREQWSEARRLGYDTLEPAQVEGWRADGHLDEARFSELAGALAAWEEARELEGKRARMEREQQDAYTRQGKIAEQLAVLRDVGPEGALRVRYVAELQTAQDRINVLESEMRRLREAADERRRAAQRGLLGLSRT